MSFLPWTVPGEPQTRIYGRIISIIRAVGMHPLRFGELEAERPTKEGLLKLARMSKKILDKYGLDTCTAKTMCLHA
jgi:biotin synthase-related radical SAM superfamily protein